MVKNAGEAAQAFTQFLSKSPATGTKYTAVDNCWKCKPKLDDLALDKKDSLASARKNKKIQQGQAENKYKDPIKMHNDNNYAYSTGE
eukprot:7401682-Ditylum_brightwellii.AAC.1